MLHMVSPAASIESCPGRPGNEAVHPCFHKLDAPDAHAFMSLFMVSGFSGYSTDEIRPVPSMD